MKLRIERVVWPNLVTLGNLFFGFVAIATVARGGDLRLAGLLLFAAAWMDIADGLVARLLGVSSKLGQELDSLADLVSFGLAPALGVYVRWLYQAEWIGLLVCSLFVCCAGFRLARYNVTPPDPSSKNYFTGMPMPISGMVPGAIALRSAPLPPALAVGLILLACLLMSSRLRCPTLPQLTFREPLWVRLLSLVVWGFGLARIDNWIWVPGAYMAYALLLNGTDLVVTWRNKRA